MVVPEIASPDSGYIEDCLPPRVLAVDMGFGEDAATAEDVFESSFNFNGIIGLSAIEKLSSTSRYWQNVLEDITETKKERFLRIQRRSESILEFIQRFPIGVEENVEQFDDHVSF